MIKWLRYKFYLWNHNRRVTKMGYIWQEATPADYAAQGARDHWGRNMTPPIRPNYDRD